MSVERTKSSSDGGVQPVRFRQSRLGLTALILAVFAVPSALMPVLGIIVSVVVLAVALIALVRAVRSPELNWSYPAIAVVIAVIALAAASLVTNVANDRIKQCGAETVDQASDCLQNNQ